MNQLKTKIEEVKEKLGLTQMQLSERIGKNPYYLDTVKRRGVTTERQLELIRELDLVANGGTVMTEREIVADLNNKLECYQRRNEDSQAANIELSRKLDFAEKQYMELNDAYGRACEKFVDVNKQVASLQEYKRQYRDLVVIMIVVGIIIILGFALWSVV